MKGRKNVLFSMRTDSKIQYIVGKPTEGKRLKTFVNQSSDFVHDVILENLKKQKLFNLPEIEKQED